MPSFSNRPQYGEPLPLSSDYQAVSIPRSPRSPHFPEPSTRGHQYNPTGPFQPHQYAQTGPFPAQSSRVPAAPNSLSPVAMASARSAVATGPQQTMDAGPSRPSAKAGMSILFAGAIIGGLIGAVMHARQNAADAFAAAQQTHEVAPPTSASITPPISPVGTQITTILPPSDPKLLADNKKVDDKDKDKKDDASKKKGAGFKKWGGPVRGAGGGVKETTATAGDDSETTTTAASGKGKGKGKGADKDDDGYTIASADGSGGGGGSSSKADKGGDKSDKSAEKDTTKSSSKKGGGEKEPSKGDKPEGGKKSGGGKGGDDAVNVLKAAMGATENTL